VDERSGIDFLFFTFLDGGARRWIGEWFIIMWDMFYGYIKYWVMCACVRIVHL
jgi:hypothetical protein